MKPPSRLPEKFEKRTSAPQSQKRYLFFSDRDSRTTGHHVASVKKGKKDEEILYTGISSDPHAPEYKWPDRKMVWEGLASEMKFKRSEKPLVAQRRYIPTSTRHQPQGEMR